MEVLPHSGGAGGFGVLAQRLRAGGLVGLLCERDLTGSGIEVEFFGEPPGSWAARPRSPCRPEPR
jgi:phosphatidylinositol dimannoside acyltransferase